MKNYIQKQEELAQVQKKFKGIQFLFTHCVDCFHLDRLSKGLIEEEIICRNYTSKNNFAITTGIVLRVDHIKKTNEMFITLLCEGKVHFATTDYITRNKILEITEKKKNMSKEQSDEESENSFAIWENKAFFLKLKRGEVTLLQSLDTSIFEETVALTKRLFDTNSGEIVI